MQLVCFNTLKLNAQDYYPIVDTTINKMWCNLGICTGCGPGDQDSAIYFYKLSGDTVINSKTYKRILHLDTKHHNNRYDWFSDGFMREENKKVYYTDKFSKREWLNYDFSKQVGDTFLSGIRKVSAIDEVMIYNKLRKHYYIVDDNGHACDEWIEGIGSITFQLLTPNSCGTVGSMNVVLCYSEDNVVKFTNPRFNLCYSKNPDALINTNKLWSMQRITVANPSSYWSYYLKIIDQDTTINNKIYKKVLRSDDEFHLKWEYYCCLRETFDKKIYRIGGPTGIDKGNDTIEYLIYDFNLKKGDKFVVGKVDSVKDVIIGDRSRKCLYFGNNYWVTDTWIEGIGSLCGLLNVGLCSWMGGECSLLCYLENDTIKYHNSEYNYCFYKKSVNIEELERTNLGIKIYPNPANIQSVISYDLSEKSNVIFTIYDMMGREVDKLIKINEDVGEHKITYNVEKLRNGTYFYRLTAGAHSSYNKIIVIKN